jgi:hypothetical protein
MGSQYTFKEWCKKSKDSKWNQFIHALTNPWNVLDTKANGTKLIKNRTNQKLKQSK